jgi:DNA invertase Pin-like site-specific DNA recombinase
MNTYDPRVNSGIVKESGAPQGGFDERPPCALYLRKSTRDAGQQDTENQRLQLRDFCRTQGWRIVAEYEDHDSGTKSDRAGFCAMMHDAAKRKFDVLLFWSLDRLTREGALQTLQYLNTLTGYRVAYRSLSEPYLDSCGLFKDAVVAILGTIARQEQVRIRERVKAGLERARRHGTRTGRPIGRPRSVFPRDQVVGLRAEGLSWRLIAKRFGVSVASVRRAANEES